MEISDLKNITQDELFNTFQQAFADYEVQLDKKALFDMLKRRGFYPALSFGAFEANTCVSFTCNGVGDFYGKLMAYDTGTGTLKDYRGKGLATRVFEHAIPLLKDFGIHHYLLEVLQHNTDAVSVYTKLGFEVTREFYYFRTQLSDIDTHAKPFESLYSIEEIDINNCHFITGFWDFEPSWQNSINAINRSIDDFICLGFFIEERLVGYGVFEPSTGDITQIAVDRGYRRKGIGSILFQKLLSYNQQSTVKIVNTDIHCTSINGFLQSKNIAPAGKQFEMIKNL